MKSINTVRLTLVPLSLEQLNTWLNDVQALEHELVCHYRGEKLQNDFESRVRVQLSKVQNDLANWLWNTFWLILRNEDRLVIGSFQFNGAPNDEGLVRIGFELSPEFRHCGYMTEAVRAMCRWAKLQPGIYQICAQTECDNIASQKVLYQCGFIEQERNNISLWTFDA